MAIIDAWMQHPTLAFLQHEMFDPLFRWLGVDPPAEAPSIESTVEQMDAGGVERGLITAWRGPEGPILGNDDVAATVAAYPDRFVGVGSVDLSRPLHAVREVRRCVDELGFRAIRVIPWLWDLPPNDRRYYPVYTACVEAGIPFCLQVGHTGPLRPSESGRPIPYLDDVALEFPELVIVAGHIGYPWAEEMISLATKYPNVHIDTSAYTSSADIRPSSCATCAVTDGARSCSAPTTRCSRPSSASSISMASSSTTRRPHCSCTTTPPRVFGLS